MRVSVADNLRDLRLSAFSQPTVARLLQIFKASRIDQVVDVHNPIDLTPMAGDAAFAEAVRAVVEDENVDVGIIGCVPLTAALNTLPRGEGHRDDILLEGSIVQRLVKLREALAKPWVVVIDSGSLHADPRTLAHHADRAGWACEIILEQESSEYLARLAQHRAGLAGGK